MVRNVLSRQLALPDIALSSERAKCIPDGLNSHKINPQSPCERVLGLIILLPLSHLLPCRYLESCNFPALKRKCESSANTSSSSEDDKQGQPSQNEVRTLEGKEDCHSVSRGNSKYSASGE